MYIPILGFFIVFCIWLRIEIKNHQRSIEQSHTSFFERESAANSTRKQPIDHLNYITFSEKSLSLIHINDEIVLKCLKELTVLSSKKILNLSNMTNTELKETYGVANLPILSEYDSNFITLCCTFNTLSKRLYELSYYSECRQVLDFAISLGCDSSVLYKLLGDLLYKGNDVSSLKELISKAESLNNMTAPGVISHLNSLLSSIEAPSSHNEE